MIQLAKDEISWQTYMESYFEACHNTDYEEPDNNDMPADDEQPKRPTLKRISHKKNRVKLTYLLKYVVRTIHLYLV